MYWWVIRRQATDIYGAGDEGSKYLSTYPATQIPYYLLVIDVTTTLKYRAIHRNAIIIMVIKNPLSRRERG